MTLSKMTTAAFSGSPLRLLLLATLALRIGLRRVIPCEGTHDGHDARVAFACAVSKNFLDRHDQLPFQRFMTAQVHFSNYHLPRCIPPSTCKTSPVT